MPCSLHGLDITALHFQGSGAACTHIEIKAWVDDMDALAARTAALADAGPTPIAQDDTFFACPGDGEYQAAACLADGTGELDLLPAQPIAAGLKDVVLPAFPPTASPDTLRDALTLAHWAGAGRACASSAHAVRFRPHARAPRSRSKAWVS